MTFPRDLTPDDLTIVGDILSDSFYDDPVLAWCKQGPEAAAALFRSTVKHTILPYGFGQILSGGEGAALWMPPGERGQPGFIGLMFMLFGILFTAGPQAAWRGKIIDDLMKKEHPKEPHYYLAAIGVRRGFQGKGLGKTMMNQVLARADAEGMPAYLESSKLANVPIYRSVGFEVTKELIARPDAPTLYAMWREPKS